MAVINDLVGRYANDGAADAAMAAVPWAKSEGVMYYDTTLNQFKRWDAVLSAWVFDAGATGAFPGIQTVQALFVDQGTNVATDGSAASPFHSIQAAYTAAIALTPTATKQVAIIIMGGTYVDANACVNCNTPYIHLIGMGMFSTILRNTAVASPTVILAADEVRIENLSIYCSVANQNALSVQNCDAYVSNVFVEGGGADGATSLIVGSTPDVTFEHCIFSVVSGGGGYIARIAPASGNVHFQDCQFGGYSNGAIDIRGGDLVGFYHCYFRYDQTSYNAYILCTTNAQVNVNIIGCVFPSQFNTPCISDQIGDVITIDGCHFATTNQYGIYCVAATILRVVGCNFQTGTANSIYPAARLTTPAEVVGNRMQVGMMGYTRTKNPVKLVGGDYDCYPNTYEAFISIYDSKSIVRLMKDDTYTGALYMDNTFTFTLDGQDRFQLSRVTPGYPLFQLTGDRKLKLLGVKLIGGIEVTGDTAELEVIRSTVYGQILINGGDEESSFVELVESDIIGDTAYNEAMKIANANPIIRIDDCYLQGQTGYSAIHDTVAVAGNPNITMQNTTVIGYPGDPGTPAMTTDNATTYTGYQNGFSSAPSGYTNNVATPYDVVDAAITIDTVRRHRIPG